MQPLLYFKYLAEGTVTVSYEDILVLYNSDKNSRLRDFLRKVSSAKTELVRKINNGIWLSDWRLKGKRPGPRKRLFFKIMVTKICVELHEH